MKQYLRHILYYTICIVFFVFSIWALRLFIGIKEGFETTGPPFLILVGKTAAGAIYYADVDVPFTPKWQASALTATGSIGVAYGDLYTITGASSIPKKSSYDAASSANTSSPALTQISVDDDGTIGGVDATGNVYYGSAKNTSTLMSWVSFSGTNAYGVGKDGSLYFSGNPGSGTWTKTNAGTTWKQVVLSGPLVCAINIAGELFYAMNDITTSQIIWNGNSPIASRRFDYISLQGRRLIGIVNSKIYFADDVTSSYGYREIPIKLYNNMGELLTTTPPSFTAVEIMYPDPSARRKRFADITRTSGSAGSVASTIKKTCSFSETLIGNYCYQPCPNGQAANGAMCPYLRQHIPAKATCPAGTDVINNTCFNTCSSSYTSMQAGSSDGSRGSSRIANYTVDPANIQQCIGATIPKIRTQPTIPARPAGYRRCDAFNGSIEARYVRIRPTKSYNNNKLCLQNVTVMGYMVAADGTVGTSLVNLSSSRTAFSTDGTCAPGPIGGETCSFKSGDTFDSDKDGGQLARSATTYWEVDLGSLHYVKSVAITGCSNTSAGMGDDTIKQISGLRVQILTKNDSTSQVLTERILGPTATQTVTYNFGAGNAQITDPPPNTCYDECPMVAGVQSVAQGNGSCLLTLDTITNRSITTPQIVRSKVILPPADFLDSSSRPIDTKWVADPNDITQYLTCSKFPGSKMVAIKKTIQGNEYSYKNSSNQPITGESGFICIKSTTISQTMCPAYSSTNNANRSDLMKYMYDPTTLSCYIPRNLNRVWSCDHMCNNNLFYGGESGKYACDIPGGIDGFTYCCTGRTSVSGRGGEQRCWTKTSVYDENAGNNYGMTARDNFSLPLIPADLLRLPDRMPAKIGCFDANGDNTPGIFEYNNACARCVSVNDTYYAAGLLIPEITRGDDYGMLSGQPVAYTTNTTGTKEATPIPTAFADDFIELPSTANPSVTATTTTTTLDEQYAPPGIAPTPPPLTGSQRATATVTRLITDGISLATNFFTSLTSFKPNGLPTVKYVQGFQSLMRTLQTTQIQPTGYSSGICVGKCSRDFSSVLPVQMHKIQGTYTLWGTACKAPTTILVLQDKIPAEYVPASESVCSEHSAYNSSDQYCYTECSTDQKDNGTSCTYKNIPRSYISPTYSCTNPALTLDGSVCLYGCEAGTVANGRYCEPEPVILPNLPKMYGYDVIMCNKTPGGIKSGKNINKWLCESSENAYLLVSTPCNDANDPACIFPDDQVTNPNIPYSYVGTNDIICYADSSGSTVYVCQGASEYLNAGKTSEELQVTSQLTCDNLSTAYLDLSNNLTVLASSGSMAQTSATRVANMKATLEGVFNVLCDPLTPISSCPTLKSQIAALNSSINSGSSTLANIINPYQIGLSSRTMLVGQMNSMGCAIPT